MMTGLLVRYSFCPQSWHLLRSSDNGILPLSQRVHPPSESKCLAPTHGSGAGVGAGAGAGVGAGAGAGAGSADGSADGSGDPFWQLSMSHSLWSWHTNSSNASGSVPSHCPPALHT